MDKEEIFNTLVFVNEIDEIDKTMKYAVVPMTMDDYLYFKQAHGYVYGDGEYSPEVEQAVVDLDAALYKLDSDKPWGNVDRIRSWRKFVTVTSDIRNVDYVIAMEYF